MARGPFAVDPNSAAEISPIQLRGGTNTVVPQPDFGGAIADVANVVGTKIAADNQKEAINDVKGQLNTFQDALRVSKFPSLEKTFFGAEAQKNPYFQSVLKEFTAIQSAQQAGRLTSEFAVERMEALVSQSIARNPAFATEIKAAARDALGFDPSSKSIANLLKQSPEEQAGEQLRQQAARNGLTVEQQQAINGAVVKSGLEKQQLELLKARGEYDANMLAQEARLDTANTFVTIMEKVQQLTRAGGITDPDVLANEVRAQFGSIRARLLSNLPGTVPSSAVNAQLETIQKQEETLISMVTSGSMETLVNTQKDLLVSIAQRDVAQLPGIGRLYAVDSKAALDILGTISKYRDNPQALAAAVQLEFEGAITTAAILEGVPGAVDVVLGNREAQNQNEARFAAFISGKRIQTASPDNPIDDKESVSLIKTMRQAGEDLTIGTLASPRIVRNLTSSKGSHGELINMFNTQLANLKQDYQRMQAEGLLPETAGKLNSNGRLDITETFIAAPNREGGRPAGQYNEWTVRMNRLLNYADAYKTSGVFPDSVYASPQGVLTNVQTLPEGTTQATQPETSTVVKWGRDASGRPVRLQQ